jgi:hypothetical protein
VASRGVGTGDEQLGSSGSSRFQERAALRRQLRQVGFQNIRILDAANLVQANTPDGRSILIMVDPPRAAVSGVGANQQNQSSGIGQGNNRSGQSGSGD